MKHNSNVPAFLTKLWTLVEDSDTNEFICWSQEGTSFLVLDEQRFAKEILPKFFKHNNMASFVRQLNMYGFRKVMHIDTGIVKQERDGPVEFQHPYFKHGQDDLLENIKRKVSTSRPEENKVRQEDLSKILSSVQNVHGKQDSLDSRLATLKRENEALWGEITDLRQKHTNQQQVIKELVQFIFTLVQNNRILNLKRKRPLLLNSNGKKSKFIHQIYDEHADHSKVCAQGSVNGLGGLKNSADISEDVIICDVTTEDSEIVTESSRALDQMDFEIIEVTEGNTVTPTTLTEEDDPAVESEELCRSMTDGLPTSSALQLNKPCSLSQEDPVKMMDSILKESGAISQNINLLGKVELMDYLDSIDCSLEDFQAMLYGKHFSIEPDILEATDGPKGTIELFSKEGKLDSDNADKQLIQYTTCPLLAFLDGCTPLTPTDPETPAPLTTSTGSRFSTTSALSTSLLDTDSLVGIGSGTVPEDGPPADLLAAPTESEEKRRSTLIRLEPLTEAEASEATLFYLCELNPEGDEVESTLPLDL
ncbi:heat shock factor protein 2 isoform X2 [Clupea harengus]|uniref:Heat shock factor protein 2 isoform X2 n=1 Tax=Clupea harengus TaxID=7950 RepID=A0A6P8GQZ3_CLUHA|nr:heat shock factor protein 2 isoform X2 [Clupea harengus]